MMDLAEIRKKARSQDEREGGKGTEVRTAAPSYSSSIQGHPRDEPSTPHPPLPPAVESPGWEAEDPDPLEALFNWRPEIDLATEDSYHEGLMGQKGESEEDLRQWLTFSIGDEEYALDLVDIAEIIKPREVTDIPRVPDFILGILSLRGIITPVYDLKRRLKLGESVVSPNSRIVICQQNDTLAGLLVDRINQVVRLPAGRIEPPPAVLSGLDRDMVGGVGRHQDRMMILLHLPSVLDAELS